MQEKFRVYFSFAQEDREQIRDLESRLRANGLETWFDEKDLTAGSDWRDLIRTAIPGCDALLSCVSTRSLSRAGFYQRELEIAVQLQRDRPGFIIPVRLDDCQIPAYYPASAITWIDVFEKDGIERLIQELKRKAALLRGPPAAVLERAVPAAPKPIRILHLSDLHFKEGDDHEQLINILDEDIADLIKNDRVDYLVVSGDLSDRCNAVGYQHATHFLTGLQARQNVPQGRCVLVPGNHDVQQDISCFDIRKSADGDAVEALVGDLSTRLYLVRKTDSYADRFRGFADVHKAFTGRDYDLADPRKQVCVVVSDDHRLQFLCLNSAWEIDQFRPRRASIHENALEDGLNLLRRKPDYLGVAVWHHAITGNDKIRNDKFLGRLGKRGIRLCLHGDVHELRPDIVNPYDANRIHIAGIGSFGAAAGDRPESTPRMFNLIEIDPSHSRASIWTRQQSHRGAPFETYATWSVPGQSDRRSGRYEFTLDPVGSTA